VFSDPHEKVQLGVIKERVLFVTNRLDRNVEAVRARGRFEREALGSFPEEVLEYEKLFSLNNSRLRSVHTRIRGVADISILDVRRFLQYLTRQRELVGLPDGKAGIKVAPVKRIYHLNLVVRCTADGEDLFRKIRLIVGPEGIRRVEPVNGG
jgi:hypothetical protein